MALQAWDKDLREQLKIQQAQIESLQQQLMIGEKRPDSPTREPGGPPWPGYPNPMPPGKDWPPGKLAHGEGRGPQPKYHDEYNQPLNIPPWLHTDPSGNEMEVPWQKEQYINEHPELMISGASSQQIRDRLMPFTRGLRDYDKEGGGFMPGIPDALKIQLLRDARA